MHNLFKILFVGITLLLTACNDSNSNANAAENQGLETFPVIEVPVRTLTSYSSYPATIEGTVESAVRAKVPGYITNVLVDEGEQVEKGETLFTLETETLTRDAEAAQAEVNAAQVEVDKLIPLVEKNIISEVRLETAKARLAQAQSRYNSVAANIGYATIKSPVKGNVGAINFRSGALVSPNDPIPLTLVSQTEEVYAFFSMNEKDYFTFLENTEGESLSEKLENFPEVTLFLAGDREYPHKGEIETVNAQVNQQTGTVNFRATFPNPNGILASGNSGTVRIPKEFEDVLVIPSKSTYESQGRVYTFKVTEGDTVRRNLVEVEESTKKLYVVSEGLEENDRIVAEGVSKLQNNTRINPKPTNFDSIVKDTPTFFN